MAVAAERCRSAGKSFWITEFGAPWHGKYLGIQGTPELQKQYFEGYCKRFWANAIGPQVVMAWEISPNPKQPDLNGLYDGNTGSFRPAFDVYTRYMLGRETTPLTTAGSDKTGCLLLSQ